MNDEFKNLLVSESIRFEENVSLKKHTSFRTGGNCRIMVFPDTAEKVSFLLKHRDGMIFRFIGNGTNLLAPDDPGDDIYISSALLNGISVDRETAVVYANGGALLSRVSYQAYKNSLSGLEFAHGIPGSVGGGCVMNAGAYNEQLSDVIVATDYVAADGQLIRVVGEEHQFGYRKSVFAPGDFVIGTEIKLRKGDKRLIKEKMNDLDTRRRNSQPLELPSAGSTFKRPHGYFAGKLIEDAGLKGYSVGGAKVSEKHAGFIVNYNNATSADILALIGEVTEIVKKKFGVVLEPEVRIIQAGK